MDQRDRVIALSQMTTYDSFVTGLSKTKDYLAIVSVPPKVRGDKEKWVAVNPFNGIIQTNIRQPDEGRVALCGNQISSYTDKVCYWYDNELPCCIACLIVMAVVFSVLTTPIILLCLVPVIHRLKKVCSHNIHELQWHDTVN